MAEQPCAPATAKVAGGALLIKVASEGDFVIQLTPQLALPLKEKPPNKQPIGKRPRIVQFQVDKAILQGHSDFFQSFLTSRPDTSIVTFESKGTGFGYALEIWLRAIHNGPNNLPPNLKATHTERAWVAIGVGEQFGFAPQHIDKLKPWFLDCYDYAMNNGSGLTPMAACCLAFPCSVFDHADGFMKLTKYLAYKTNGSIFSHNPSNFHTLDQDARILDGPLTTARAHIQSVLDKELFFPIEKLHRATCVCRKETAFEYQETLMALDCWPVDRAIMKYPLTDIIDELEKFEFTPKTKTCDSGACLHDFKNSVNIAIRKARFAFDGLCLDCIERSQVDEEPYQDYINRNSPYKGCWDMDCRFGHGRATWYFSWMGPSPARRDILSKYRQEKRALGITSRGKRGRRGKRGTTESFAHRQQDQSAPANYRDKENNGAQDRGPEYEDEEEFFDAEDDYIDGTPRADDGEFDHVHADRA